MRNGGIKGYKALQSSGNGNCLFNGVSILLFGNESKAVEHRVTVTLCSYKYSLLTAGKMIHSSKMLSKMSDLLIVSPSYLDATVDCEKRKMVLCLDHAGIGSSH